MRTKMLPPTGILVSVLFGCASHQQAGTSVPSASEASDSPSPSSPGVRIVKSRDGSFDGEIIGTPAPNSKFAKLEIGMGLRQVEDLIGRADDTDSHIRGKQFIPFFFGGVLQEGGPAYLFAGALWRCSRRIDPHYGGS
jgi:hypothetical protein